MTFLFGVASDLSVAVALLLTIGSIDGNIIIFLRRYNIQTKIYKYYNIHTRK